MAACTTQLWPLIDRESTSHPVSLSNLPKPCTLPTGEIQCLTSDFQYAPCSSVRAVRVSKVRHAHSQLELELSELELQFELHTATPRKNEQMINDNGRLDLTSEIRAV